LKSEELLLLQQLATLDYLDQVQIEPPVGKAPDSDLIGGEQSKTFSTPNTQVHDVRVDLHKWQHEFLDIWFENDCQGVAEVATGAGKTVVALAASDRYIKTKGSNPLFVVIVPTKVLQTQWAESINHFFGVGQCSIAFLGGGRNVKVAPNSRFLICMLQTAWKKLGDEITNAGDKRDIVLILDECHTIGSDKFKTVLDVPHHAVLGLSATPDRNDGGEILEQDEDIEESIDLSYEVMEPSALDQMGGKIYSYSLADALDDGILANFIIDHYGLPLTSNERAKYQQQTRSIREVESNLKFRSRGQPLFQFAIKLAKSAKNPDSEAAKYIQLMSERKSLLWRCEARRVALSALIDKSFSQNPKARILVFHERIDEINSLFIELRARGLNVALEHSQLPKDLRERALKLFSDGTANILLSAKSLTVGFNLPEIDVAIVMASSTSVRQRIQSLGRVLRKSTVAKKEKRAHVHILYAESTTDDMIYGKVDWQKLTGVDNNVFWKWDGVGEPSAQPGPPRQVRPDDISLDEATLESGLAYPGRREGLELNVDTAGNLSSGKGDLKNLIPTDSVLGQALITYVNKPHNSYFLTTRRNFLVRVDVGAILEDGTHSYEYIFIAKLENLNKLLKYDATEQDSTGIKPSQSDITLKFSQAKGGQLVRRINRDLTLYAIKDPTQAKCKACAQNAVTLINLLKLATPPIRDLYIRENTLVFGKTNGRYEEIITLLDGLEFPD
jgi:superfamily II DNA or RNA helicase